MKSNFVEVCAAIAAAAVLSAGRAAAGTFFLESEAFADRGGWVLDTQFMDQMGSPYLLAHGMGVKVADAETVFEAGERDAGVYSVWARTANWVKNVYVRQGKTPPLVTPGLFEIRVNGEALPVRIGSQGDGTWLWVKAGEVKIKAGINSVKLCDLDGFDGRCDAVVLTDEKDPGRILDGPRGVYTDHLDELKALMKKGVGDGGVHPPQMYNLQTSLDPRFVDRKAGNFQKRIAPGAILVDDALPAGNIVVEGIKDGIVRLRPDLRGSRPWFYWAFRVRGAAGRTLRFVFTDKDPGGPVGVRGPVVSTDAGASFSYPLDGKSSPDGFVYTFGLNENDVRFYECHPYVRGDWDSFTAKHKKYLGRRMRLETLCRSRSGAEVPAARFGCVGEGMTPKYRFFMCARNHASETMASWVLEGAAEAFLADDELGAWLAGNVELMAVPFVDYDGVQAGDQGKNRVPHDHNRDYTSFIYPETKALTEWVLPHAGGGLYAFIDLHCPWIRGKYNEFVYSPLKPFGTKASEELDSRFAKILETVQTGGLRYKASNDLPYGKGWNTGSNYRQGLSCTQWAQKTLDGLKICRTFEIPFANADGEVVTPEKCRAFGRDMVRALCETITQSDH